MGGVSRYFSESIGVRGRFGFLKRQKILHAQGLQRSEGD